MSPLDITTSTLELRGLAWGLNVGAGIVLVFSLLSCRSKGDVASFPGVDAEQPVPAPSDIEVNADSALQIRLLRLIGSDQGPNSFGAIGRGAVSQRGIIAITDIESCEVVFIAEASGAAVGRIGRCGVGPGEFRSLTSLQFVADTLVAWDAFQKQLIFILPPNRELYRIRVQRSGNTRNPINEVYVVDDSTLVATYAVFPRFGRDTSSPRMFLGVLDRRSGTTLSESLLPPYVGDANSSPVVNNVASCVHLGSKPPVIVAMNQWSFQAVILSLPDLGVERSIRSDVPFVRPMPDPRVSSGRRPSSASFGAACTTDWVFLWHLGRSRGRDSVPLPYARHEIRDYDGRLYYASNTSVMDGLRLERVLAATPRKVWVRVKSARGYPLIAEFVVERSGYRRLF